MTLRSTDLRVTLLVVVALAVAGCASTGAPSQSGVPLPFTLAGVDISDDPRLVLRDRLDVAGPERGSSVRGTSFSHRSRRYHAYPFTTYGNSTVEIRLRTQDDRMAERSALWVLGPRQQDGRYTQVQSAVGADIRVAVQSSGFAEFVALVGPATPVEFLPRYPGVEAVFGAELAGGYDEELATLEAQPDGSVQLHFAGEYAAESGELAGRRFRVEDPVTQAPNVEALTAQAFDFVFARECDDTMCLATRGEALAFAPQAWTRYQLFAPEGAESLNDTRVAALHDPQEGDFTVFTATSPHRPEAVFRILDAIGADGLPNLADPVMVRVVPEAHESCEVDVVDAAGCNGEERNCSIPKCLGGAPVPEDLPILSYRATALDIDETSFYDIEARCQGTCSPSASPTRYPIYFAHGFNSSKEVWSDVTQRLIDHDSRWTGWFSAASVPAFEPVWRRAEQLRRNLAEFLVSLDQQGHRPVDGEAFQRVNVVAHSMGGLDSRVLVGDPIYNNSECHRKLECTDAEGNPEPCCASDEAGQAIPWRARIASVTTLSTPHGGSSFADVGVELLEKRSVDWAFRKAARHVLGLDSEEKQQHLRDTLYTLSNRYSQDVMSRDYPVPQPRRAYAYACATGFESCEVPAEAELPPREGLLPPPNERVTFFGWASESCVTGVCGSIVDPTLALSYAIVKQREGPSDGVVATRSAGFGISMGIRANDHFHWNRFSFAQVVDVAARVFGVRREPVDRFYRHWLGTLSRSGY